MSALTAYIYPKHTYTSPQKLFTFNNNLCVHWTRNFGFTKLWHVHQAPLYHSLFKKKKMSLRPCNTRNKCVHIYLISVICCNRWYGLVYYSWWFNIDDVPPVEFYPREVFFLPWSYGTYVIRWWQLLYTEALKLSFDVHYINKSSQSFFKHIFSFFLESGGRGGE